MKEEYKLVSDLFFALKNIYKEQDLIHCVLHIRNIGSHYAYLEIEHGKKADNFHIYQTSKIENYFNLPLDIVNKSKDILGILQYLGTTEFKIKKRQSFDMFIHHYFEFEHEMLLQHHYAKVTKFHEKLDKCVKNKINEIKKIKI